MPNPIFLNAANLQMKHLICRHLLFLALMLTCAVRIALAQSPQSASKPPSSAQRLPANSAFVPAEGFYFLMNDYKMEHQGEVNTLNIKVSYEYNAGIADDQYPDFIPIRKDVDTFLREYPNEMTFWEIVNKQLTAMVLAKYPAIASVTCEIQVTPSPQYQFTRGSIVTRHRAKARKSATSK